MHNTIDFSKRLYDALLVTSRENVYYLSGFSGTSGWLLITDKERHLFTDFRYVEQATYQVEGYIIHKVKTFDEINGVLKKEAVKKLGFEDAAMTVREFSAFSKLGITLVPASNDILALRSIKTEAEIEKIMAAQRLTEDAFSHLYKNIRIGMTEREAAFILESYVKTHGAEGVSFDPIVASGKNGAMPHATPTDRAFTSGDFVVIDFGCKLFGYCADMTRTIGIGEVSDEQKKVYDIVLSAQRAALNFARPGISGHELDKAARDVIESAGFGAQFGHSLGHGVGVEIHESPTATVNSKDIFAPGMFVSVEPGIYLEGKFGVRIEDLIVFTPDGYINCNKLSKELLCLG